MRRTQRLIVSASIILSAIIAVSIYSSSAQPVGSFAVKNLIGSSGAPKRDKLMINAWGNAFSPGSPFWINDEGTGVSELIDGKGKIYKPLPFVRVPGPNGATGRPTGIIANGTSDFALTSGGPARFIFDGEDGIISGWNQGKNAVIVVNNSAAHADYTGLAMANDNGKNLLYAANQNGTVDVFDTSF